MPRVDGRGRGALQVIVQVDVPRDLSSRAKELLRQLEDELARAGRRPRRRSVPGGPGFRAASGPIETVLTRPRGGSPPPAEPSSIRPRSAGTTTSASASAKLGTEPEAWFGSGRTPSSPLSSSSRARRNSSRPGSRVTVARSAARRRGGSGAASPCSARRSGTPKSRKVSDADAGLPGRPSTCAGARAADRERLAGLDLHLPEVDDDAGRLERRRASRRDRRRSRRRPSRPRRCRGARSATARSRRLGVVARRRARPARGRRPPAPRRRRSSRSTRGCCPAAAAGGPGRARAARRRSRAR